MAEVALSVTSSVVSLLTLTGYTLQGVKSLNNILREIKHLPHEQEYLEAELRALVPILGSLQENPSFTAAVFRGPLHSAPRDCICNPRLEKPYGAIEDRPGKIQAHKGMEAVPASIVRATARTKSREAGNMEDYTHSSIRQSLKVSPLSSRRGCIVNQAIVCQCDSKRQRTQ